MSAAPSRSAAPGHVAANAGRARIGRVVANSGRDILVLIESPGDARAQLRIGDIVLVAGETMATIGTVSGMNAPAPGLENDGADIWLAQVELSGTFSLVEGGTGFGRSIPVPPALGDVAFKASSADLRRLFRNGDPAAYPIGLVLGQDDVAATVDARGLLEGSFAIVGTTGSGKSSTLASIVRALLRHRHPMRIVLVDPYNEYGQSFGRAALTIDPVPGLFPHWLLSFDELVWAFSCNGDALDDAERSILEEAIPAARLRFMHRGTATRETRSSVDSVSVDTPTPYRATDLIAYIDKNTHTDDVRSGASYRRLRTRIMAALADPRLAVVFGGTASTDNLESLMRRLFRLETNAPPMAVLRLGKLTAGLDRILVAVVCRLAAALAEWSDGKHRTLVLIEDVARYAPTTPADRETQLALKSLRDLGGRSRKLGTTIGLVASHPRTVSRDILAQCGTFFVHRMPSQADVDFIEDILPETAMASLVGVGNLGPGEAVAVGRGVPLPARIAIAPLPPGTVPGEVPAVLATEADGADDLAALIERWRSGGGGAVASGG